jgi:hypothetical protein
VSDVRRARWPWVGLGLFFAWAIAGLVGVSVNGESIGEQIPYVVAFTMFGVVGALLVSRAPGNWIGALLLYGASTAAAAFAAGELGTYLVGEGVTEGFWVAGALILSNLGWVLGILPVLFFLPLLFPDGHLPSRRWLPFAWFFVVVIGSLTIASLVGDPTISGSDESVKIANPLYISSLPQIELPDWFFRILLLSLLAGAVAAVVVRFRRSEGVERQQMKWVAVALALVVVSFALSEVLSALGLYSDLIDTIVSAPAFLAIPISIGIAVLQYHLYDLDVVLKKTLVFVVLVVLLTAVFLVGLLAVGSVFAGSGLIDWNVAMFVVLFVTGVLIAPLWRVARRIADRFVYGTRATPYEVMTEFSERMGEAYATEDVLGRMAQILGQATGAASARVWLRVGGLLRPAASWPSDAEPADEAVVNGDALPELPGESAVEVRDRDELLGALSVTMPPSDPMNLPKERLVRDLASQAGLVLRNVRLVEELAPSLAAAARQRPGPGAPAARAQHPRRRPAAARRPVGQDQAPRATSRRATPPRPPRCSRRSTPRSRRRWTTSATWRAASTRRSWWIRVSAPRWRPRPGGRPSRSRSGPRASAATPPRSRRRSTSRAWRPSRTSPSTRRRARPR